MSPDEWMDTLGINLHDEDVRTRIEALQWELTQRLLKLGLVVIIEWGTWGRSERDTLRIGARELGAAVELRYVSAPPDILIERIQTRDRENPPIPQDTMLNWFKSFQPPTEDEFALYDKPAEVKPDPGNGSLRG